MLEHLSATFDDNDAYPDSMAFLERFLTPYSTVTELTKCREQVKAHTIEFIQVDPNLISKLKDFSPKNWLKDLVLEAPISTQISLDHIQETFYPSIATPKTPPFPVSKTQSDELSQSYACVDAALKSITVDFEELKKLPHLAESRILSEIYDRLPFPPNQPPVHLREIEIQEKLQRLRVDVSTRLGAIEQEMQKVMDEEKMRDKKAQEALDDSPKLFPINCFDPNANRFHERFAALPRERQFAILERDEKIAQDYFKSVFGDPEAP